MVQWKRSLLFLGAAILGFLALTIASGLLAADFLVDLWWFDSLDYSFYFWQRLLYRYVIFAAVTLLFFSIFFLNFWAASQHLGTTAPPPASLRPTSLQVYKDLYKMFRTGSLWVYTPLSLVLAIPIALPLFRQWEAFLLFLAAPRMGVADPVYGKDISYYLFSFPIYTLLQRRFLITFLLLLASVIFLYWLEHRLLAQKHERLARGAKWHITILIIFNFLIGIWGLVLQRYSLLYTTSHEPLFFGPGYVEMRIILPLIWVCLLSLAGVGISLVLFIQSRKAFAPLAIFTLLFLLALGARYSTFLPDMVQKYIVRPNEIARERPYIENNIQATLSAYDLGHVEVREFRPQRIPRDVTTPEVHHILRNIPVWDGELLLDVYEQLQELRTYYVFRTVDVNRFTVRGNYQQVFLAARELNLDELPTGARNWINDHLTYTHGYGLVMTPAAQGGEEPMVWFFRGIPLESEFDFTVDQPGIYYGKLKQYTYVVAPNDAGEFHYPKGDTNVRRDYTGRGGIPIASLFRKLVFAYYYKDRNLFFTTKTNPDSKILIRRNITEAIQRLTPFLVLDNDPFLAITPKGLYWIQDAYLTSDWYPYAEVSSTDTGPLNYIRNSIKIVFDAYNGTIDYYIFEPDDPIVRAYNRVYPGLFKPKDRMPPELMAQVRYPQDIFNIQMEIYAKYHQTDPEVFYKQEDIWQFAAVHLPETVSPRGRSVFQAKEPSTVKSYYLTLDLIERHKFDFLLLCPMSPKGRSNLRVLTLAGCDGENYKRIIVYDFPKGELVYGPSQIYALINQDTRIAEQFTLWDQIGSQVERGKMIILPVGDVMLYIQPVYLKAAAQLKIPQLQRLIMSQGELVVMERTLEEAYARLQERLQAERERIERRFAPELREPQPGILGIGAPEEPAREEQPPQIPEGEAPQEGAPAEGQAPQ